MDGQTDRRTDDGEFNSPPSMFLQHTAHISAENIWWQLLDTVKQVNYYSFKICEGRLPTHSFPVSHYYWTSALSKMGNQAT